MSGGTAKEEEKALFGCEDKKVFCWEDKNVLSLILGATRGAVKEEGREEEKVEDWRVERN